MKISLAVAAAVLAALAQGGLPRPSEIAPARLISRSVPSIPVTMVAGGQAFFELTIDVDGRVAGVTTLRSTPPLTGMVADVVRTWRFEPSERRMDSATETIRFAFRMPRVSSVFVGAVYRAPVLIGPTLGAVPIDMAPPHDETPLPVTIGSPVYPAGAFCGGVVLVELQIDAAGSVCDARVLTSAPPFDQAALDAARQFRFRPGRVDGEPTASYAYVMFGFPVPITGRPR